jgi:hypothetical protein
MQTTSIRQGEPLYVRAYSTQRAAVAELISLLRRGDREWGQVRMMTEWHDWDNAPLTDGPAPRIGEVVQIEAYRLEAIRW